MEPEKPKDSIDYSENRSFEVENEEGDVVENFDKEYKKDVYDYSYSYYYYIEMELFKMKLLLTVKTRKVALMKYPIH